MGKTYHIKNPAELALITNPMADSKPPKSTKPATKKGSKEKMRKNPATTALGTAKDLLVPAAGILGGQIVANQVTRIVDSFVPDSLGIVKKAVPAGIPLLVGVALVTMTKNPILRFAGIGMGASAISAGVKQVAPTVGAYMPLADRLADLMDKTEPYLPAPTPAFLPADFTEVSPLRPTPDVPSSEFLADWEDSQFLNEDEQAWLM